jgi:hypothetical protein
MFHYELKNGRIEVFAHKGGSNKEGTLTFDIVSTDRDLPATVAINLKVLT